MHDAAVDGDPLTRILDRFKEPEPAGGLPSPAKARFAWWAYAPRSTDMDTEIAGLARSPEEAPAALVAELRATWEILDESRPDVDAFVADLLEDYAGGALVCVVAGDELAAWRAWFAVSGRLPDAAFEAWRAVFPASSAADPVGDDARRMIALEAGC